VLPLGAHSPLKHSSTSYSHNTPPNPLEQLHTKALIPSKQEADPIPQGLEAHSLLKKRKQREKQNKRKQTGETQVNFFPLFLKT
jgi:hypothetical protein